MHRRDRARLQRSGRRAGSGADALAGTRRRKIEGFWLPFPRISQRVIISNRHRARQSCAAQGPTATARRTMMPQSQVFYAADAMLDSEHLQFRSAFRRFVEERLAPLAALGERERRFPLEVYKELREGGYLAPGCPEEIGGVRRRYPGRLCLLRGTPAASHLRGVRRRIRASTSGAQTAADAGERRAKARIPAAGGARQVSAPSR